MTEKLRLFVGVPLDADALAHVDTLAGKLRDACTEGRWKASWVGPKNMHITLEFLGDVDAARAEGIGPALEGMRVHAPFEIELGGFGAFPSVARPSVLWIGVRAGTAELSALATEVQSRLEPLGFVPEAREYQPHVTLARVKRPGSALAPILRSFEASRGCQSRVREIVLYHSVLEQSGSVYHPLRRIPLGTQ